MKEAKHNTLAKKVFDIYLHRLFRKHFESMILVGLPPLDHKPIFLMQNHHSWWDGFFAYIANQKILQKKFHILMLEDQLKKYPFFNKLGAFGINRENPKSILNTINYILNLSLVNNNLITFYPQGDIFPSYSKMELMKGTYQILKKLSPDCLKLLMYTHIEYGKNKLPTLYIMFADLSNHESIEYDFEQLRSDILTAIENEDVSKQKIL